MINKNYICALRLCARNRLSSIQLDELEKLSDVQKFVSTVMYHEICLVVEKKQQRYGREWNSKRVRLSVNLSILQLILSNLNGVIILRI